MLNPLREQNAFAYLYDYNGTEGERDGILYLFYTPRSRYERGESVPLTLVKVNTRPQEVISTYRTTQYYDFAVKRGAVPIWRWSEGKFFLQAIQQKLLLPDEMHTAQEIWTIPPDIPAGIYTLEGEDRAMNGIKLQVAIEVFSA